MSEEKSIAERWKKTQKKITKSERVKFALYVRTGKTLLSENEKATVDNQLSKEINIDAFALRSTYNAVRNPDFVSIPTLVRRREQP